MSIKDYDLFLFKIDQLNKLIDFINLHPDKYALFVECKSHNEVVELANQWGFEIDKRWGES